MSTSSRLHFLSSVLVLFSASSLVSTGEGVGSQFGVAVDAPTMECCATKAPYEEGRPYRRGNVPCLPVGDNA